MLFFFPDNSIYPLIGFFGGSSALMIIFILLLWLTYKRTKGKSKSKDPKPDTPTHGSIEFPTTNICRNTLHFSLHTLKFK